MANILKERVRFVPLVLPQDLGFMIPQTLILPQMPATQIYLATPRELHQVLLHRAWNRTCSWMRVESCLEMDCLHLYEMHPLRLSAWQRR